MGTTKETWILFIFIWAGATASYWGNVASFPESVSQSASKVQTVSSPCQQLTWDSNGKGVAGGYATFVHQGGKTCVTTNIGRCCTSSGLSNSSSNIKSFPLAKTKVKTNDQDWDVKVLQSKEDKPCLYITEGGVFQEYKHCEAGTDTCISRKKCQNPNIVCVNNTNSIDDCDSDGCDTCKTGYKPRDCCKCEDKYVDVNGKGICQLPCVQNCDKYKGDICEVCRTRYGYPPLCCKCIPPYIMDDNKQCVCPNTTIIKDGKCENCSTDQIPDEKQEKCICKLKEGEIRVNGKCVCQLKEGQIRVNETCVDCGTGMIPDEDRKKCICKLKEGEIRVNGKCVCKPKEGQIRVNNKCINVCEGATDCTNTSCTCTPLLLPPTCCDCRNGNKTGSGDCPVKCIDNQQIMIIFDRSQGNGNSQLARAFYAIELLVGALLKNKTNLDISVYGYAGSYNTRNLINLMPEFIPGEEVTSIRCTDILTKLEEETFKHRGPRDTYANVTMKLLQDKINPNTPTTVIVFAGTTSVASVNSIQEYVNDLKANFNVSLFSAGYEGDYFTESDTRYTEYTDEVEALGGDQRNHYFKKSIEDEPKQFLTQIVDNLYNAGILCSKEKTKILSPPRDSIEDYFKDFSICNPKRRRQYNLKPCISSSSHDYDYVCNDESAEEQLEDEQTLVSLMRSFLDKFSY